MYNKINIVGKKGKTVCYTIQNLQITEDASSIKIKWDPWKFYTPGGNREEAETGCKYFEIQALDETLTRETLDKEIQIAIKLDTESGESNIYVIEKYLEEQGDLPIKIEGLEGDFVLWGIIQADPGQEIQIEYKEVTDADF
jgi:hypothetical protein